MTGISPVVVLIPNTYPPWEGWETRTDIPFPSNCNRILGDPKCVSSVSSEKFLMITEQCES